MNVGNGMYIDTPEALESLTRRLREYSWLAVDTEFQREKTYYPKLCLIQVAAPDFACCIDPLAISDIDPLLDVLYDSNITKVMHAARQDLEILFHIRGSLPSSLFDTQIAAPLLGHPEQAGYATLVDRVLNIKLSKSHTRADWTRRPLPENQIRYAADDVIYLARLYPLLHAELVSRGRLHWLDDDFAELENPDLYQASPEKSWQRIRGIERLQARQLCVLQALAAWREETAQQENRPRNWLLRDDVLVDIARQIPDNRDDLAHIRGLSERMLKRHGTAVLELIAGAGRQEPQPLPDTRRRARLKPEQDALVDAMMSMVQIVALKESLSPAVLASRKQLAALLQQQDNRDIELLHGWRRNLIGTQLRAFLRGELVLRVEDGELSVVDNT